MSAKYDRGTIQGKTGKTAVLTWFCKVEHGGGSANTPLCYGGLGLPGRTGRTGGAPVWDTSSESEDFEKLCKIFEMHQILCFKDFSLVSLLWKNWLCFLYAKWTLNLFFWIHTRGKLPGPGHDSFLSFVKTCISEENIARSQLGYEK